jgi:hypothetical protein
MKTEVGRNWYQSIHFGKLSCLASKCTKDAENVYASLVMVSIGGRKRTHGVKRVHHNGSIDTNFDPPLFSTVPLNRKNDLFYSIFQMT